MLCDMTLVNMSGKRVKTSIFNRLNPHPQPFPNQEEREFKSSYAYISSRVCRKKAFFKLGRVKSKPQDLKKSSATLMAMIS